jgi:hypothetical protein
VLDEDQHVQPFEQHRLDDQKVTRDDRVSGQNCRQVGFPCAIRTISVLTGRRVPGRPGRRLSEKVHLSATRLRCQCKIVAGATGNTSAHRRRWTSRDNAVSRQPLRAIFAPLDRMALTNYLTAAPRMAHY